MDKIKQDEARQFRDLLLNIANPANSENTFLDINDSKAHIESSFQIFVNYDICNFTRYKNEHSNWLELLQRFIEFSSDRTEEFPPDCSLRFWKFSGDAITFRQAVTSIYEIVNAIQSADKLLNRMQDVLNKNNSSNYSNVFVKAAIWIAEFSSQENSDNIQLSKSEFGQEFVGKNMDEGFRLSACSKAGVLAVDPKIVHILNIYSHFFNKKNEVKSIDKIIDDRCIKAVKDSKDGCDWENVINEMREKVLQSCDVNNYYKAINLIKTINDGLYFINYERCKGVWSEREYPIFWYIDNIEDRRFIYDEIVGGKNLRDHCLYKLSSCGNKSDADSLKEEFIVKKIQLAVIFEQVKISNIIYHFLSKLEFLPHMSEDYHIYDTANLYYMVANVVKKNQEDLGILIFKRREKNRKHLKNVWDLLPVKHTPIKNVKCENMLKEYLESRMAYILNNSNIEFNILVDKYRNSIIPISICNVYRNGIVHNGILCLSEIDITNSDKDIFLKNIKDNLSQTGYCDVKLVSLDDIGVDYGEDYIKIDELLIRSLTSNEVSEDSYNVSIDSQVIPNFRSYNGEEQFGIAYLSGSIKQILEGRKKGLYI